MLLVIDNCEHLVVDVAIVIDELTRRCWNLRILATSREALRVAAERVYSIPSLEASGPGVQLFCERASAADASFSADGHLDALVQICERVDGIPLAIELATARVRALTVEELLERLHDRFRFCAEAAAARSIDTTRSEPPSRGRISSSPTRSASCSIARRSLPGDSTCAPPRRCAASTRIDRFDVFEPSARWSTSR